MLVSELGAIPATNREGAANMVKHLRAAGINVVGEWDDLPDVLWFFGNMKCLMCGNVEGAIYPGSADSSRLECGHCGSQDSVVRFWLHPETGEAVWNDDELEPWEIGDV